MTVRFVDTASGSIEDDYAFDCDGYRASKIPEAEAVPS